MLQLSLNIVFIVVLRLGVAGLLWSTFTTNLLLGAGMTAWLLRQTGMHFDWGILRALRRFGAPYQLTWAGSFLLTFGDRFFLQAARGDGRSRPVRAGVPVRLPARRSSARPRS